MIEKELVHLPSKKSLVREVHACRSELQRLLKKNEKARNDHKSFFAMHTADATFKTLSRDTWREERKMLNMQTNYGEMRKEFHELQARVNQARFTLAKLNVDITETEATNAITIQYIENEKELWCPWKSEEFQKTFRIGHSGDPKQIIKCACENHNNSNLKQVTHKYQTCTLVHNKWNNKQNKQRFRLWQKRFRVCSPSPPLKNKS